MINIDALQEAIRHDISILRSSRPLIVTKRPLQEAVNHITAEAIIAPMDLPRQPVSAMDGYALATNSPRQAQQMFSVVGESVAGAPFEGEMKPCQAVRIMTGAVVPSQSDTVVMQENVTRHHEDELPIITLNKMIQQGKNIRQQGEEIQAGETLIDPGTPINPSHICLLASMGIAELNTYAPLSVGLIASGDELRHVGEPLSTNSQIYNANTPSLRALLSNLPIRLIDYGIMPDDLSATKAVLSKASETCDVVITSAGVSVGDYDYLTTAIEELGTISHYKVAMKPGKPFVQGTLNKPDGNGECFYFGLPGNPLSTFIGCLLLVKPALWQLAGAAQPNQMLHFAATLSATVKKRPGRRDFQRGIMTQRADGNWDVAPLNTQDSHRVKGLSQANCLIDLPEESADKAVGDSVMVIPLGNTVGGF